jgi:hypothetical protein
VVIGDSTGAMDCNIKTGGFSLFKASETALLALVAKLVFRLIL